MADNLLYNTALNKAMSLCAEREMCYSDITRKLISWGINNEDAGKILHHLTQGKFIDELRYATAFVKDKFRYNKWGKVKISAALRMKKIPEEKITDALHSIDDEDYINQLRNIIERQRKTVNAKNQFDMKGKILRHCLAKGFESHLVYDLLRIEE
jgi:regulatory protein